MANAQIIEMKARKVAEVAEKFKKAQSVVFFDYRGLTVEEVTNLGRHLNSYVTALIICYRENRKKKQKK